VAAVNIRNFAGHEKVCNMISMSYFKVKATLNSKFPSMILIGKKTSILKNFNVLVGEKKHRQGTLQFREPSIYREISP